MTIREKLVKDGYAYGRKYKYEVYKITKSGKVYAYKYEKYFRNQNGEKQLNWKAHASETLTLKIVEVKR